MKFISTETEIKSNNQIKELHLGKITTNHVETHPSHADYHPILILEDGFDSFEIHNTYKRIQAEDTHLCKYQEVNRNSFIQLLSEEESTTDFTTHLIEISSDFGSCILLENNVGKRRIRHTTTLNLNVKKSIQYSISESSYVGSVSFRH